MKSYAHLSLLLHIFIHSNQLYVICYILLSNFAVVIYRYFFFSYSTFTYEMSM